LIQNDVVADAMIPQLLNLLRMKKIRDIEAYWIAATFWNKALDHYAFGPFPHRLSFEVVAECLERGIWRIVINGVNMLLR
jgi:hypothetical protein